jgi:RimJ/RimL family protein N-acetyltransferase
MTNPTLQGDNLILRRATLHDAEGLFSLPTDPHIHEMFGGSADTLSERTRESAQAWAQSLVDHPFAWVIEYGKIIGATRLDRVDMRDRRASFAIGIYCPDLLGKGLGTEAARLVLVFAFGQLKLHRIALRVIAYNERAIRCYQKCGFKIEGREREAGFVNGSWHDDIMMGLLETEYVSNFSGE